MDQPMCSKRYLFIMCTAALLIGAAVLAANSKQKVLVEQNSLRILAGDKFPEELDCEIYVGQNGFPHFRTEGPHRRMKSASIEIDLGPSVSVIRKEGEGNSYLLYLFFEDEEGKVVGLFDLNFDGTWDVKKSPTRKKNFILVDGEWIEVARIDGILSTKPIAEGQGVRYEFRGNWKPIK